MKSCSRSDYLSVSGVFEHIKSSRVTAGLLPEKEKKNTTVC